MQSNQTSPSSLPSLCLDILENNTAQVLETINNLKFDVNEKTTNNHSLIFYAVLTGNETLVEALIDKGADLTGTYDGLSLRDITQQRLALLNLTDRFQRNLNVIAAEREKFSNIDKLLEAQVEYDPASLKQYTSSITVPPNTTQHWITYAMKKAGYESADGYCHGVAYMGVQALLNDERDTKGNLKALAEFENRIRYLAMKYVSYNPNNAIPKYKYKRLLRAQLWNENDEVRREKIQKIIEEERKKEEEIHIDEVQIKKAKAEAEAEAEAKRIEQKAKDAFIDDKLDAYDLSESKIPAFLDGVELYQRMEKHKYLVEPEHLLEKFNFFHSSGLPAIPLAQSVHNEKKGGIVVATTFTGVYSFAEFKSICEKIANQAKTEDYSKPIAIPLSSPSSNHTITIGYDPVKQTWHLIDANLNEIKHVTTAQITAEVWKGFVTDTNSSLIVSGNILCTAQQAEELKTKIITPLLRSDAWINAHTITKEKLRYTGKGTIKLEELALKHGDLDTFNAIKKFEAFSRNKRTLLYVGVAVFTLSAYILLNVFLGGLPSVMIAGACVMGAIFVGAGVYRSRYLSRVNASLHATPLYKDANSLSEMKKSWWQQAMSTSKVSNYFISKRTSRKTANTSSKKSEIITLEDEKPGNEKPGNEKLEVKKTMPSEKTPLLRTTTPPKKTF